ncbi:WD repeat-containing protein 70 [Sesbania bispinosa]|nr:WD repeat-containing protein 70 [Sesbania bispinosa]
MEEDGEIYDGVRAQFPLSFGKQTKSQTSLEEIHNATRRTSNSNSKTTNDFPSLSSSSKEWLKSLRPSRNPTPPPPQPDEEDDGPLVGPPPPPSGLGPENHDDDEMIGPPPPPPRDYNLEDDSDQTELGNRFRIPLSNEIVLKGHTKVRFSCSTRMGFSLTPHLRIDEEFGKESQDRGGGGEGYPSSHPHLSVMSLRSDGSLCVADSFRHFAAPEGIACHSRPHV